MADTEIEKTTEAVETQAVEEVKSEEVVESEPEVSPYDKLSSFEKEQYKMGWRPKELFQGDDKYWKTAELFAKDSELYAEMNRQKKLLYELQAKDKQHEQELRQVQRIAYDKALKDLTEQRNEAIVLGKLQDAANYDAQLDQIKRQVTQPVTQPPPLSPEAQQWIRERPWILSPQIYNKALAFEDDVRNESPELGMVERFNKVEEKLKTKFPEYFPNEPRKVEREVKTPMVESPRQTKAVKPVEENYFEKLSEDQKAVVRRMAKASPTPMTNEEYAKKVFEFAKNQGKSIQ
jgi:hypothetical protein